MITLENFSAHADLFGQGELERVRRIVYFICKRDGVSEVSIGSIIEVIDALHINRPNVSRLRANANSRNGFVRASSAANLKINFQKIKEYDDLYSGLFVREKRNKIPGVEKDGLYVSSSRLMQIEALSSSALDFKKLSALLRELNGAAEREAYFSVAMLVRAIIDHVPPVFGFKVFAEVVSNYSGAKSFKDSMRHLNDGARKIADAHLHVPIRAREVLPNERQVDFSQSLDVLLSEIVRIS